MRPSVCASKLVTCALCLAVAACCAPRGASSCLSVCVHVQALQRERVGKTPASSSRAS